MTARAAVVGIGHSKVYRRDDVPLIELAIEACRNAIGDVGLKPRDIDGIASNPDQPFEGGGAIDGVDLVSPGLMREALGLDTRWAQQVTSSTFGKTVIHGINAVAAGACNYALVFKALYSPKGRYGHVDPGAVSGYGSGGRLSGQFHAPYGPTPVAAAAFLAQRYMHKYGATREQLGQFVVNNRRNAMAWEWGYWRNQQAAPLTLDDYLNARMISRPLGLHDCDLPVHGCAALVITTPERARDLRQPPAYVLGTATPVPMFPPRIWILEEFQAAGKHFAAQLCAAAGIGPADMDVVNFYDGFSIFPSLWLEAFGLCGEGQGFDMLARVTALSPRELWVNTSGGNLGAGRMHGLPHLIDGALQAMGRAGERQVKDAEISVAVIGAQVDGAGIVFSRSDR